MQSAYIRDERKYDKWGAQGKLLVIQEALLHIGITLPPERLEQIANIAFPRTFSCRQRESTPEENIPYEQITAYYTYVKELFEMHDVDETKLESLVLEETAEKFCLREDQIEAYVYPAE